MSIFFYLPQLLLLRSLFSFEREIKIHYHPLTVLSRRVLPLLPLIAPNVD